MKKILLVLISVFLFGASSYAIDQVILTTGEIIEGRVLNEVPNRHVDIQLVNGTKKRFAFSQVSRVERDVPSNRDSDMYANDRRVYFGPMLGGLTSFNSGSSVYFTYGARFGINVSQLGDSKLAVQLGFKRISESVGTASGSLNYLDLGILFRRLGNSGFYIGPQLGLLIASGTSSTGFTATGTLFNIGADVGYDYHFSPSFSLGPDVQLNYILDASTATISFGLNGTFHFD